MQTLNTFWANQRIPRTIAEAGAETDLTTEAGNGTTEAGNETTEAGNGTTEAGNETTTGAAPHTSIIEPHMQLADYRMHWNLSIKDLRIKSTSLIRTLPVVPAATYREVY